MSAASVCYWLVGRDNREQPMAVAIDLHGEDSELIGETRTFTVKSARAARRKAFMVGRTEGISAGDVHFDPDSTEFYAKA